MRILLALLVLVAAVVALLLWLPARGAPAVVEPVAVAPAEPGPRAPLDLEPSAPSTETARSVGEDRSAPPAAADAASTQCRIEIVLVCAEKPFDGQADVQCVDGLGRRVKCEPADARTWLVTDALAGEYHADARPRGGWTAAGARFVVEPGERTKRVEVTLHPAQALRVRWQSTDGQPITAALLQPGVLAGPALLRVVLGLERAQPGDPAPPSSLQFSLSHNVRPDADPAQQQAPTPPWDEAPPDAFGVLVLPSAPPCAVNASIGGIVVESADVTPGMTEILFRTNVDVVRAWRATLRFCVVAAESGEPISGVSCMVNLFGGIGHGTTVLRPDGCHEEPSMMPGVWMLTLQAYDRAPHFREIAVSAGADLDLGTIALKKDCPVRAQLRLPDGSPAAGVTGLLLPVDRFGWGQLTKSAAANGGILSFASVPDENHVIVVVDDRWCTAPVLVEPCGNDGVRAPLTIQLEEGIPVALDFGPTSLLAPFVLVTDANGLPVARRQIGVTGLVSLRLVPGDYLVVRPERPGANAFKVGRESVVFEVR